MSKWETVGQKLVKFKMPKINYRKLRTKIPVFCCVCHKIRGFHNYLQNRTATRGHSHSMVPMGLGVMSKTTRLMPSTSWVIRSVMWCRMG